MSRDGALVIQAIRDTAAANPDKIDFPIFFTAEENYTNFESDEHRYVDIHNDCPACLIGEALVTGLGVDQGLLSQLEGDAASRVVKLLGYTLESEEEDWIDSVQVTQDDGHTWAYAIRFADQENNNGNR